MSDDTTTHGPSSEIISACSARNERLRAAMAEHELDAMLVGHDRDIQYLTNFVGDDTYVMVRRDGSEILTDTRYEHALNAWKGTGIAEPYMATRHRLPDSVAARCSAHGIKRLGIQADQMTIAAGKSLATALSGVDVFETTGIVGTLRMCKDALEVSLIEQASRIQEEALRRTLNKLQIGMTENELFAELHYQMKCLGAMEASFNSIIGSGPGSALPHYETGDQPITEGVLLIDWGARYQWYCSDLTRTFGVGSMPAKIREIYTIVLESQMAAIDACEPGKTCASIDGVARKVITDAGYGEYFTHGLGHGLGIEVHENPYFNDLQTDVILAPGMVMTVEPGIYLPGVGGVRIEDDILITENGSRVLSDYPKDLDSAIIEPVAAGAAS
jgi:Xaa-Pro aminopeptidase